MALPGLRTHVPGQGECPTPFLQVDYFPYRGGFEDGRLCAPVPGNITCCLPCPLTDWVYPDNFHRLSMVANYLNVGGVVCCVVLLISFFVLPVKKTRRHYLTVCLITACGLMSLSFIIPLATKPDECYDGITPNNQSTDLTCAFSGALVTFGGFAAVTWVFLRSLSLHLQICWQFLAGRKYFIGSLILGWGIPAISLGLFMPLSGVSYRFGNTCHINHNLAAETFWGPMLAFAAAAVLLQFATLIYCIRVYIRAMFQDEQATTQLSQVPSYHLSERTVVTARAAYRRIKKVVMLQWRGIAVVLIIVVDVIFFATIFIESDNTQQGIINDRTKATPWLLCLGLTGDKNKCLDRTSSLVVAEPTVMAVLYLLSLNGYWCLIFLGSPKMISAWITLIRRPRGPKLEFVSRDAHRLSDPRHYEMLTSPPQAYHNKNFYDIKASPISEIGSPHTLSIAGDRKEYFRAEDAYDAMPQPLNFSRPRGLSRSTSDASGYHPHSRVTSMSSDTPPIPTSPNPNASHLALERIGSPSSPRTGSALDSHNRALGLSQRAWVGQHRTPDWNPARAAQASASRTSNRSPEQGGRSSAQGFSWNDRI